MKKPKHHSRLALLLTLYVFFIMVASIFVVISVAVLLFRLGVFIPQVALMPILTIIIVSGILGIALSAFFSRYTVRNIDSIFNAIDEVSKGNFKVRIDTKQVSQLFYFSEKINNMAKELESIQTLRSDFVSNFSHEFKTPIVSIRGFARLLKKPELTETERGEYLDIIIEESNRLAQLATNSLTLSKLDSQNILNDKAELKLDEQIRQSVLLLANSWQKKNIDVEINMPPVVYVGSSSLLEQLWINLLSNAIKFTGENGKIQINSRIQDNNLTVFFEDNGCGMSENTVNHIFDRYFQGDQSHSTEGNGLGMSIAKRIVDLHGGTIDIESKPGTGSTFAITLPL